MVKALCLQLEIGGALCILLPIEYRQFVRRGNKVLINGDDVAQGILIMKNFSLLFTLFVLASCSSQSYIEKQIEATEENLELTAEKYEDYNDELAELLEEQEYNYKKMLKARMAAREVSQKIESRQKRIDALQNPPAAKEGEAKPVVNPEVLAKHQERLKEYEMESKEISAEVELYTKRSRSATVRALQFRKNRDITYSRFLKVEADLEKLKKRAEDLNK